MIFYKPLPLFTEIVYLHLQSLHICILYLYSYMYEYADCNCIVVFIETIIEINEMNE